MFHESKAPAEAGGFFSMFGKSCCGLSGVDTFLKSGCGLSVVLIF